MFSRCQLAVEQFLGRKFTNIIIYFTIGLILDSWFLKWTSCLLTLLFLLYAPSNLKQSFRSFPFHHELLKGKSSFQECKIAVLKIEPTRIRPYCWRQIIFLLWLQAIRILSCQCSVKGYCSVLNVVRFPWKHILSLEDTKKVVSV